MTFSAEDSVLRDYPSNKKCPNNYLRNRTTKLCTRKKTKKLGSETKRIFVQPGVIDNDKSPTSGGVTFGNPVVVDDSDKKYTVRNLKKKPAVKENSEELDYPENKRCPSGYTRNKLTRKCSRKKQKQPQIFESIKVASPLRSPPETKTLVFPAWSPFVGSESVRAMSHSVKPIVQPAVIKSISPVSKTSTPLMVERVVQPAISPVIQLQPAVSPVMQPAVSPVMQPAVSPVMQPAVSPVVQAEVSPVVQAAVSPVMQPAVSPVMQPAVSPVVQAAVSPVVQAAVSPVMQPAVSPVVQAAVSPVVQDAVSPVMQPAVSPVVQAEVTPVVQAAVSPVMQPAVSPVVQAAVSPVVQSAVSPVVVVRPEERHWSSKYGYCYRVNDLGEIRWETLEEKVKAEREIEVNMVYDQTTNKVDAPECPRYITGLNLTDIAQKMRTESVKVLDRSGYKIVFSLEDDYTANLTRSLQEDQILKVNLKLKQKDKVVTLPSFWEVWFRSDNKLKTAIVNLANKLAREGNDPNEAKWILQKDFGYKIPTTFMPSYAKSIYEYFGAKRILDPCAGWGDRFAGALASNRVEQYIAFDPNTRLRYGHTKTAEAFGVLPIVYNEEKVVFNKGHEIHYLPFEIGAQKLLSDSFDLVFTSPPFFDYEMYNEDNPNYVDWIKEFYIPLVIHSERCVKPGGHVCLYLGDTSAGRIQSFLEHDVSKLTSLKFVYEIGFIGLNSSKVRGINVYKKPE